MKDACNPEEIHEEGEVDQRQETDEEEEPPDRRSMRAARARQSNMTHEHTTEH